MRTTKNNDTKRIQCNILKVFIGIDKYSINDYNILNIKLTGSSPEAHFARMVFRVRVRVRVRPRQNIVFVYATRIILRRTSTLAFIHNKYSQTNFTTVTHHSITTPKVPLR